MCAAQKGLRVGRIREGLRSKHCVAVYRKIARESPNLTDAEYRVLDVLLDYSNRLENCFPGRRTVLKALGGKKRSLRALDQHRHSLEKKGWLKRCTLYADDEGRFEVVKNECVVSVDEHGKVEEVEREDEDQPIIRGRFVSATGYRFNVPQGEISPLDPGFSGPVKFTNRVYGQAAKRKPSG